MDYSYILICICLYMSMEGKAETAGLLILHASNYMSIDDTT